MSLFDYSRKMTVANDIVKTQNKDVLKEKSDDIIEQAVVEEKSSTTMSDPVILRQLDASLVTSSLKPGMLRVEFDDVSSDSGKGFMFLKPDDIVPSKGVDGNVLSNKVDVCIARDGELSPYFIMKNGSFVSSDKSVSSFVDDWATKHQMETDVARKSAKEAIYAHNLTDRGVDYE